MIFNKKISALHINSLSRPFHPPCRSTIFFRDHLRSKMGIICGPGSFAVQYGIICGPGIICGTVWGSFAVLGSFADPYSCKLGTLRSPTATSTKASPENITLLYHNCFAVILFRSLLTIWARHRKNKLIRAVTK